ncbi:hypothetical protein BH11PSE10_BH11PSE10_10830 [soil metagenome]
MTQNSSLRSTSIRAATAAAVFGFAMPVHAAFTVYTDAATWQAAVVSVTSINFDDLADGTTLAGPYAGVSFSAFNGGYPQAAIYNFAHSGLNVVSLALPVLTGGGGGVAMDFAMAQQGVAFWYLDSEIAGNGVTVFNGANQLLGNFEMFYPNPNPIAWRFVGFVDSAQGIGRIEVAINGGDMVALDSLQMAPVPEPASAAMTLLGGALLWAARRHAASGSRGGAQ